MLCFKKRERGDIYFCFGKIFSSHKRNSHDGSGVFGAGPHSQFQRVEDGGLEAILL